MLGLAAPTPASAQEGKKGGTLRVAMVVKEQKDPRTYDWMEMANVSRTWLEPLVLPTAFDQMMRPLTLRGKTLRNRVVSGAHRQHGGRRPAGRPPRGL